MKKIFNNQDHQFLAIQNVANVNKYANLAAMQSAVGGANGGVGLGINDTFEGIAIDTRKKYEWNGTALVEVIEATEDSSGSIVFNPAAFTAGVELVFDLNDDASIAEQFNAAKSATYQEALSKFLIATGISIYYEDGTDFIATESTQIRVISKSQIGILVDVDATLVVSVELKLKSVINSFKFETGLAPTLVDFQTLLGITLTDALLENDTITFSNTNYTIPAGFLKGNIDILEVVTAADSIQTEAFSTCDNMISFVAPLVSFINEGAFKDCSTMTTIILNGVTTGFTSYAFENCTGIKYWDISKASALTNYTGSTDATLFNGITGQTLTVKVLDVHRTINGGNLHASLQYLADNNTVTFDWVL